MRESFVGFPELDLPAPRVILARGRFFPQFSGQILAAASTTHLVRLPPTQGVVEILAGGIFNPNAASAASVALAARIGGTIVGQAILNTDAVDNDTITVRSIAANTPGLLKLTLWPDLQLPGLVSLGVGQGGVITLPVNGAFLTNAMRLTPTTTANVFDGPLELSIIQTGTGAAFALDFVRVVEYPEPERLPA
jgi:hypothetical protein